MRFLSATWPGPSRRLVAPRLIARDITSFGPIANLVHLGTQAGFRDPPFGPDSPRVLLRAAPVRRGISPAVVHCSGDERCWSHQGNHDVETGSSLQET
ncbi:hypothetical protein Pan216_40750 [Planctomycetes bacterium Pan216]|uniref:Uncharacterized protein n=1 Tax=Kolteria novifilia TaxID=2527975 RepID=A0A518B8A6_9BACT|nr:hypothetical protein Pan216_40750 [Planctomycetes bacterium Pan216]